MKPLNLSLLLLLFPVYLFSQDYLGDDMDFFQKKAELYQRWLDAKGLGEALKKDKVELNKNDTELELFLSLRTSDPDTAAALWPELRRQFSKANPGQSLEEVLYNTFVRMMEIPPAQGNLQIYIPHKNRRGYNPCFYIWIWEEDGAVQTKSRINNCKAQPLNIEVNPPKVQDVAHQASVALDDQSESREVFEAILDYARQRYERSREDCERRNPRVEELETTDYTLEFSVTDLCREVLTDEKQSLWCDFVELWWGPCNDMRRERLEFTINYVPTDQGYLLTGSLTGKFGSGVYKPRVSGYMDMEPDFEEDFLKPYVRRFQNDLQSYLLGKD